MWDVRLASSDDERIAALALLAGELATWSAEADESTVDPATAHFDVLAVMQLAEAGLIDLSGLWGAYTSDGLIGAALGLSDPSGVTAFFPPVCLANDPCERLAVGRDLLTAIRQRAERAGHWMAQCILPADADSKAADMTLWGAPELARLDRMRWISQPVLPVSLPAGIQTVPFQPGENEALFAHALEETYVNSLDCPALNPHRSGAEALQVHLTDGDRASWTVFQLGERTLGVLLLSADRDVPGRGRVAYFGVSHRSRGQGLGRMLMRYGLLLVRELGWTRLDLDVDSLNTPAITVYGGLDFRVVGALRVHVMFPQPVSH